ncbi:MAG TPA: hypothetical protein VGM94_00945 [Galbitalea sp.]|jgi:hypothetical protein
MTNYDNRNVRSLLKQLGVGDFNATMMVQDSFSAPATSDPKSPQIILMVKRIQEHLGVPVTGYLDDDTADALAQVVGPGWMSLPWIDNVSTLLARTSSATGAPPYSVQAVKRLRPTPPDPHLLNSLEGFLDFLPDVPGGIITYAVAGYFVYRHFSKKRRAA